MESGGINLFDLERDELERLFVEVVLPLLEMSEDRFKRRQCEIDTEFERASAEARNESERIDAQGWAVVKETVLDEQKDAIAAALLNVICSGIKASLEGMSRYFDVSHPAKERYDGKSWLHRKQAEFKDRFGIDFETRLNELNTIEEMILARNAYIHGDDALREYREKVKKPRFADKLCLRFESAAFVDSFEDADRFLKWAWTNLKQIAEEHDVKLTGYLYA